MHLDTKRPLAPRPPMPLFAQASMREAQRAATLRAVLSTPLPLPTLAASLREHGWDAVVCARGLRVEGYALAYHRKLGWFAATGGQDQQAYQGHACLRLLLTARAWRDADASALAVPCLWNPARALPN